MQRRVFISPKKYIQGAGVLAQLGEEVEKIGKAPLILSDETVWGITGDAVEKSFKASNISYSYEEFGGEASVTEIDRLTEVGKENNADVVIGLGGGKTIDTAKAVGDNLDIAVVAAPTTASTDAPTRDRKSTRLNSSHVAISYAVFCLKQKTHT